MSWKRFFFLLFMIAVIVASFIVLLASYTHVSGQDTPYIAYIPHAAVGEREVVNEWMVDLFIDVSVPEDDAEVWLYADPDVTFMELNPVWDYTVLEGYHIIGVAFYWYEDSRYTGFFTPIDEYRYCIPAHTFVQVGEGWLLEEIGGEWCVTRYWVNGYRFENSSPWPVDVIIVALEKGGMIPSEPPLP
jgi:hypothetical protein